jgi:hypothetical protein
MSIALHVQTLFETNETAASNLIDVLLFMSVEFDFSVLAGICSISLHNYLHLERV